MRTVLCVILAAYALFLSACSSAPPKDLQDSCAIFEEKKKWYRWARQSQQKWGASIGLQLAIIYQESRFDDDAKTPRRKLLWVIPWKRKSSAYGYAQVVNQTWRTYRESTGRRGADRDDFYDVVDFIGWYVYGSWAKLGIQKNDVYRQYLAFHEGRGGYRNKSYLKKPWLMKVARDVAARADSYNRQLRRCEKNLQKRRWFWFF